MARVYSKAVRTRRGYWTVMYLVLSRWMRKIIVEQLWKRNKSLYMKAILIDEIVWKRKIASYDTYKTIRHNFSIEILRGQMKEEGHG